MVARLCVGCSYRMENRGSRFTLPFEVARVPFVLFILAFSMPFFEVQFGLLWLGVDDARRSVTHCCVSSIFHCLFAVICIQRLCVMICEALHTFADSPLLSLSALSFFILE